MDSHSTSRCAFPLAILVGLCLPSAILAAENNAAPAPAPLADQRTAILDNFRNDAALADVYCINNALAWAVGDRGVIWHTADGGATWNQQASGVHCELASVFFLDARRGWIVGGECQPFPQPARGVVLRTEDGGQTWSHVPNLVLPRLARVQFFDEQHGLAIGESSSSAASGVFATQDGGQTWQPLPADRSGGWLAGDFLDPEAGAVAGAGGRIGTLARRQVVHSPLAAPALNSYHAMRLFAPTGGWLVGDGGLLLTTADLGRSWQPPPGELPEFAATQFDFHALAVRGMHVWAAGSPGTRIIHSPDAGATWQLLPTGQTAPIRALAFADDQHGWAVGDLGIILATNDGGQIWQPQRSGGQRAALVALFATENDVPLELLAELGAADGYIAAVSLVHGPNAAAESPVDTSTLARSRAAMLLAGAASADTAWRFPLPDNDLVHSPAELLAALNRANDGRAIEQLERHLVRTLRMWRPDVVVTHDSNVDRSAPQAALVAALAMRAIDAAADPAHHADLASEIGLEPWQVKKVYGQLPADSHGAESLASSRFSPWLGATLIDFASPARHVLREQQTAASPALQFALLRCSVESEAAARGFFGGITLANGSDARRPQLPPPTNDLEELRRLAARRRQLEELLTRNAGTAAWAAEVARLVDDLPPNEAGELLTQLADGYRNTGQLDLAGDTYFTLARRYPEHPLADRALTWLVQFYASSETAIAANTVSTRRLTDVRQTSFEETQAAAPANGLSRDNRLRRAAQLAEYLKSAKPAVYAEPSVRFAEVAAQRQLGFANPAKRYFLTLRQLPESDPWRAAGETERWLAAPADLPPSKPFAACRTVVERPKLDGQLDESLWNSADRIMLRGRESFSTGDDPAQRSSPVEKDSRPPLPSTRDKAGVDEQKVAKEARPTAAELRLAYDNENLYLAVRCPKVPSVSYEKNRKPRPRDADLTQNDRITLRLDIDRDFTTAFELTVDARGWTHDACWGNSHWNPNWYVAAAEDDATWTVEAAIPLAELASEPPAARHVWAVSARRTIPRAGHETWTGDVADTSSPAQFGFLIFE